VKEILIFEPSAGGHQMHHVNLIVQSCSKAGIEGLTLLTTPNSLRHPSADALRQRANGGCLNIETVNPSENSYRLLDRVHPTLRQQFLHSSLLRRALLQCGGRKRFSHIFVPFFDAHVLWPLSLRLSSVEGISISGIVMRTKHHMPHMGVEIEPRPFLKAEKFVYKLALRRKDVCKLFTLDPFFADYAKNDRVVYIPDPATFSPSTSRSRARESLGIADDQFMILVYGLLDQRKAVPALLKAMTDARVSKNVGVLLAGVQKLEVQSCVDGPIGQALCSDGRLIVRNGYVPEDEEDNLFCAADVVWICYVNAEGPSGVLAKAGRAARPVISSSKGVCGRIVRDGKFGWLANPHCVESVGAAIRAAYAEIPQREEASRNVARRFEKHTPENFARPIVEHLACVARD
jgi:glycosyltransferase involved in cell wall biosynthesis